MSCLPSPPPPAGFGPGMAAPGVHPPPSPAAPPSPYGTTQPQFAPKVRIRKTPEMLGYRAVDTLGTIVAALFATWIPLSIYSVVLSLDQRFGMVHAFAGVLVLIVVPLFLIWFARAYGNLPTISPGPTQSRTTKA